MKKISDEIQDAIFMFAKGCLVIVVWQIEFRATYLISPFVEICNLLDVGTRSSSILLTDLEFFFF